MYRKSLLQFNFMIAFLKFIHHFCFPQLYFWSSFFGSFISDSFLIIIFLFYMFLFHNLPSKIVYLVLRYWRICPWLHLLLWRCFKCHGSSFEVIYLPTPPPIYTLSSLCVVFNLTANGLGLFLFSVWISWISKT